jgi:hypothetical protein
VEWAEPTGFTFNGQERYDEINVGLYTAEYWEYDARLGRRWNVDPKHYAWESPYSVMGDNPISRTDVKGDKWKDKKNDAKKAKQLDRQLANKERNYASKAKDYEKMARKNKDKNEEQYNMFKNLALLAKEGQTQMADARRELAEMGSEETEQVFHFELIDKNATTAKTYMDKEGVINMQYYEGEDAIAIHEANHGYQYFTGRQKYTKAGTEFTDIHDEVRAYRRQYFFEPSSVTDLELDNGETIGSYDRIRAEFIHRIVATDDEGRKFTPYLNRSDNDLPMLIEP